MIRCVVFDIDDTLYLERDYVRSGFDAVGRWASAVLGVDCLGDVAWQLFLAGRRGRIFDEALLICGRQVDPTTIDSLVSCYRAHRPRICLLPDAEAAIGRLAGRPMAVVSDGPPGSQLAKVAALGLASTMAPLVLTGELGDGRGKPHPLAFHLVEEAIGARADECLYVADNPAKDFAGPQSLGWRTVRVRRPLALHHAVESGPDVEVEIEQLAELPTLLTGGRR